MKIEGEVKTENDNMAAWRERNEKDAAEQAEKDEKTAINFYGISGVVIVIAGVLIALLSNLYAGINTAALGAVVMGIGEILRYLRKMSKR